MKKKNFTRFWAFALVLIKVFTLSFCFTVTTSAEETDATPTADYIFYPTTETMTLDGNANEMIWSMVPAVSFTKGDAFMKGVYTEEAGKKVLYIYAEWVDYDLDYTHNGATWTHDGFEFVIVVPGSTEVLDSSGYYAAPAYRFSRLRTNVQFVTGNSFNTVGAINTTGTTYFNHVMHAIQDNRQNGGKVSVEIRYEIPSTCEGTFDFNLFIQQNVSPTASHTIAGWQQNYLKTTDIDYRKPGGLATGYLATVEPNMLAGAGMRLATDVNDSGLRFETQINKASYDALIAAGATVTTGTLILPTESIPTGTLTKQALLDAGAVDVKNTGWANADTAETDGYYTFFGSIVKIKEANISKAFSGISYVTVTQDGNSVTYLSNYNEADHSRDVRTVAQAALDSGRYDAYESILNAYLQ